MLSFYIKPGNNRSSQSNKFQRTVNHFSPKFEPGDVVDLDMITAHDEQNSRHFRRRRKCRKL